MECTVSFLIPVYNSASVLAETLDSILDQDDGSIEIICVNDGSTDSSGDVLSSYSKTHSCVRVVSQQNQGITAARNAALSHATGQWVCFVDNDDIVAANAVSVIHQVTDDTCDIVYFNYQRFSSSLPDQSDNRVGNDRYLRGKDIEKLQSDCINRFRSNVPLISHSVLPTPWAKVYRLEFLRTHNLCFRQEVTHEEDIVFNFEVLAHVNVAKMVDYTMYYYRWSVYSESHRYRPQMASSASETLCAYHDIVQRCYADRQDIALLYRYRVLWELMYCVFLGPMHQQNPQSYGKRRQQFRTLLRSPEYRGVFNGISTLKFEPFQSILATCIRFRQFWLLNLLGKIVGKFR
ncbi:MAG: glycosyltransferase [Bifidobacterium psychraerophilum]|uniref:glycosyltransferase family 2 protein n=1 Tax=Bifidobacterium psychraerophilum TaxID=218140 RepID=UPI0039EBB98E